MQLRIFLSTIIVFFHLVCNAQYWQQKVDFTIDVKLDDKQKTLDGFAKILYTNNSPDTLNYIWFHIWPNAYKNDRTAFSNQRLENGNTDFYFSDKEQRGYINKLDFKVNGTTARLEDHPQHIDIIKLVLPSPLAPKQQAVIVTPFHVKLPYNFSRGGYVGQSFQIAQWYPKPAAYDQKGWHPMPYLDEGEFYSNFGNYDVRITLPKNYVVAATGELQSAEEKEWLKQRSVYTKNAEMASPKKGLPNHQKNSAVPPSSTELKTLQYKQDNVTDFAWFADKTFIVNTDTCQLPSGKTIDVYSYYTSAQKDYWRPSIQYAKDAVRFLSNEAGEYPYNVASVVQGPESSFSGGMEYPTITLISPVSSTKTLDGVIAHEIFHNWFQGIIASNERMHPWMDEGITSFYEAKYMQQKYGKQNKLERILFHTLAAQKTDQPIEGSSEQFSSINYGLSVYYKTAEWLKSIEEKYGYDALKQFMNAYYDQWKFKHPYPTDFDALAQTMLPSIDSYLALRNAKGNLPNSNVEGFTILSPLKKHSFKNYLDSPVKNALIVSPSIGLNKYDGFMVGGIISNYKLPPNRFRFLLVPMYATRSKEIVGLAKASSTWYSNGFVRRTSLFVNASSFSMDNFLDTANRIINMKFTKIVPGIKVSFREKNPRSTAEKYVQWKTFLIGEQSLRITPDTLFSGSDTALIQRYNTPWSHRYLNQLKFVYSNHKSLYPFHYDLTIEQAQDFVRPTFTASYFFNYAKGGGLNVRLFAGKFIYLGEKTIRKQFENDRFHLNMTGPKGSEDYTYSNYFYGRNEFEGVASQQIMIRDGGFKVRTDLLADKIGKTDDWLAAVNFSSTIPKNLNPLSILPVQIPLKAYADVGTYAEAWDKNEESDRFLFNAGLELSLFKEAFNIYIPIVYNKVYGDYFKSTIPKNKLLKTISFSINLFNKDLQTINRLVDFE